VAKSANDKSNNAVRLKSDMAFFSFALGRGFPAIRIIMPQNSTFVKENFFQPLVPLSKKANANGHFDTKNSQNIWLFCNLSS